MPGETTPAFWQFLEAEALDGLEIRKGRVSQAVVIAEIEDEAAGGTRTVTISRHHSGRALRGNEAAGLMVKQLARELDKD